MENIERRQNPRGLVRSNVKIGMTDIVYNMNRLIQWINPGPGTAKLIWLKLKLVSGKSFYLKLIWVFPVDVPETRDQVRWSKDFLDRGSLMSYW